MPRTLPHRLSPGLALLLVLLALQLGACGGYAQRMASVHDRVDRADVSGALGTIDQLVGRAEDGRSPEKHDLPLLLLERGALLQAAGNHDAAVQDFTAADQMMEMLDLTPDGFSAAARYLFSDDLTLYRPPVYEKLMINLLAMSSFLHLGRTSSARVEARRARVLIEFFQSTEFADHPMIGAANYLIGVASEVAGDRSSALLFYRDAWRVAPAPGLAESLVRLSHGTPQARSAEVLEARQHLGLGPDDPPPAAREEIIVLGFSGLAPRRQAERFPVGVVYAWIATGDGVALTSEQQAQYNRIMADGLLTWVNYPILTRVENRVRGFDVSASGHSGALDHLADIESFALEEWDRQKGGIAAAAITRAITRVVAREAVRAGGRAAGVDDALFPGASWLIGAAVQGGMQAADRPDTRGWTTLPAHIHVGRIPVTPGEHTVRVQPRGASGAREFTVTVPEGGQRVIVLRTL
ncbi:MAG: hypothetical protein EA398_03955 [Deltaproteobacteria bacterium]|nr:MAG: hypothetical protein EA398_03955 [Deltaproteobacteria bacterium]